MVANVETMFSARGITPWHKLGKVIDREVTSVSEAIALAGLDWEVVSQPLYTEYTHAEALLKVPTHKVNIRSTDQKILGVVSKDYQVLQNREAFEFFTPLLADNSGITIDTAGSLAGGKKIWVLAKLKNQIADVLNNDPVEAFILLANSHDGSMAVSVILTPIRVVCQNTLSMAFSKNLTKDNPTEQSGKIDFNSKIARRRHTKGLLTDIANIREMIDLASFKFTSAVEDYKLFAKRSLTKEETRAYLERVFLNKAVLTGEKELTQRQENLVDNALGLIESLPDLEHCRGTLWAAYNAVSYYNQYEKGKEPGSDASLKSLWFGDSQQNLVKAHKEALALV